ncbi:MAG: RNA 2',3'-cyclic phosphodiesterase [Bacteroidetes bacterium]|nr:RNA 2',3'-cyclic phosphodiesterase [Bacteroidota bacterium]
MKSEDKSRRIFLAVPVPAEIISLQDKLRGKNSHLKKIKWMRNQNIHLTIYFIGNIPAEEVEDVIELILPVITEQIEFTLKFDSLFFAPSHKPEMLWVKFHKHELFSFFSENIHNALSKYLPENKFFRKDPVPHITLARFRSMKNYSDINLVSFESLRGLEIKINSCELWETIKVEGRSDYRSVMKFSF